ncbi:hypothetical protein D3C76_1166700 [compost metagenome]
MAEFAEQRLEVGLGRHQAGRRRLAELGAFRVDKAGARDMACGVAGGAGEIDQDQLIGAEQGRQVGRFDDQRQVGEGGHGSLQL